MTGPNTVSEQFARNRILRKVVVSLVVGGFVYIVTELTGQEAIWNLTMSIFLGGLTLVVQLLMSFENRLAAVEETGTNHMARLEVMIRSGFARINEVTELFNLVESSALRTDTITQLVRHATLIDPASPSLVLRFAEAEVSRFSQFLKDISESRNVLYEGEDQDWLLTLARNAVATIDATSLTTMVGEGSGYMDDLLWTSDFGQRYLEAQREAIQQGVMIRRLFVLVDGLDVIDNDEILAVCQPQQAIGIEVRVLDPADVPTAQREALFDFIVFDGAISYETTAAPRLAESTRPTILNTRLELRPDRVQGRIRRFDYLWECGRQVTAHGIAPPTLIQ